MKKIAIVGKNSEKLDKIKKEFLERGFEYSEDPDFVIVSGGDGSLLIAEREFPGVAKLLLRDSPTCQKCHDLDFKEVIRLISSGDYGVNEIKKVKAVVNSKESLGLNDIIIRNKLPNSALRFEVSINEEKIADFIGDGVVVSTSYGSGGYFSSITGKEFKQGVGLAFSNLTKPFKPIFLESYEKIRVRITRGPGILAVDNSREFIDLKEGDEIEICESGDKAKIVIL